LPCAELAQSRRSQLPCGRSTPEKYADSPREPLSLQWGGVS
jgi:hypothetical protein